MFLNYVIDVVRKHYSKLCQSIPMDYEKSISKLLELDIVPDNVLEVIYSAENKRMAIINVLILGCSNEHILTMCDIMEELIETPALKSVIEELRHGKKLHVQ